MTIKLVPYAEDYELEFAITQRDTATGASEAATGLTGLSAYFALRGALETPLGSKTFALSERSGTPGTYYAIADAADLTTALAAQHGQLVQMVCAKSGDLLTYKTVQVVAALEMS